MNCEEARESLSMLLDGELGLTERVPLELHVNACEGCQRSLAHLQELRELEQPARPAPRPVHWRPILAPGFVEKALGAIRAEDVTTRLRRLVAEKVPSRQLAVAAAVPLLVILAVFIFGRGFTVGSGMRQRPVAAPAETRSEAPVVRPVASIAPAPPTIATPVVPTRVAPPPAVVTQPVPAKPPAVVTQPAAAKPTPPADQPRSAETKVAAAGAPEAKALDVKSAPRAARSESSPKDEKASPPVASPAPAKTAVAHGSSRVAAAPGAPPTDQPIGLPRVSDYQPNPALRDIYFKFGTTAIRPGDLKILHTNAAWLRAHPQLLVLIEGHCDNRGTTSRKNEFNIDLGEQRAQAAMNHLVAEGVQSSRITILSYGEERPQCAEESERCWSQNRRSRFLVKPR
jgi:peptidoglycan-associated lipoprotein